MIKKPGFIAGFFLPGIRLIEKLTREAASPVVLSHLHIPRHLCLPAQQVYKRITDGSEWSVLTKHVDTLSAIKYRVIPYYA